MIIRCKPRTLLRLSFGLTLLFLLGGWTMNRSADLILGRWFFPARESTVEVYQERGRYFGRIIAVGEAYKAKIPENQLLFTNLVYNGKEWSGGKLIHPSTGTSYDVAIQLENPQTLNVTVYKGLRCFQRNYKLTRK